MATQSSYAVDVLTPLSAATDTITLVRGGAFVVCTPGLTIEPSGMQGFYTSDTRLISQLLLLVNGTHIFALEHDNNGEVAKATGMVGDPSRPALLVQRRMYIDDGALAMSVDLTNLEANEVDVTLDLTVTSDFADIFDVKRGRVPRNGFVGSGPSNGALVIAYENRAFRRGMRVSAQGDFEIFRDGLHVERRLGGRQATNITFNFTPEIRRYETAPEPQQCDCPVHLDASQVTGSRYESTIKTSCEDLESLLIQDPIFGEWVVAAGSPWFLTLFGRDSLITSIQTLSLTTSLAMNVLQSLAHRQGQVVNDETEEQPGRILHEIRTGEAVTRQDGWGDVYYGSVDATPLFIVTLAEAHRFGANEQQIRKLLPAAEAAREWMETFGDPDGDGFIEYAGRAMRTGLDNQAWKDSYDAIRHEDGRIAEGPIAVVEVQGYKHAALLALAYLREHLDHGDPEPLLKQANSLREQIHDLYWMDHEQCFALALDGHKQQVRSVTTNAGHLLWTQTAFEDKAAQLVSRLMQPDMFTGFGLRTLSSENPAWNPLSYHCGSVWPHDSALVAAGMFKYGEHAAAVRLSDALLDAADCCSGRLPELFAGFDRKHFPSPVPYPSSCTPQAWAAGAPLMLARWLRQEPTNVLSSSLGS